MSESLSPEQAQHLLETCPIPLLALDRQGVVRYCNRALASLLGETDGHRLAGLDSRAAGGHPLGAMLRAGDRLEWRSGDAPARHFRVQRWVSGDGDDRLEVRYFVDISREVKLERARQELRGELREHTLTDTLTGLLSRRGIMLALEPQVARSRRYNSPISVLLADIDCAGPRDALLKRVATLLKDQLRWADLVGCDEGHSFILVLPETGIEAAQRVAEKLRARIDALCAEHFPELDARVLLGAAAWQRTDSATTLLERAARALQQARGAHQPAPVAL